MSLGRPAALILPALALLYSPTAFASSPQEVVALPPVVAQTEATATPAPELVPTATPHARQNGTRPDQTATATIDLRQLLQPSPTPTLAPGETRERVYRLEQFDTNRGIYFLTLHDEGYAELATRRTGVSPLVTVAVGDWEKTVADGSEIRVVLYNGRSGPLPGANIFTVAFDHGFPTVTSIGDGTWVRPLTGMVFSLGSGDVHPLVADLHTLLAAVPWLNFTYPETSPDVFSEQTREAVARFQSAQGLVSSGAVDTDTWLALQQPTVQLPTPTAIPSPVPPVELAPAFPPSPTPTPTPTATPMPTETPIPMPTEPAAAAPAAPAGGENHAVPDLTRLATHDADGNPIIYLTFDDGPQPGSTQPILDMLAQYGAKATFFNVGANVQAYPNLVRAVVSAGHYVGDHTWDHASLQGMSAEQFLQEVNDTRQALINAAGDLMTMDGTVRLLRPPYGATDDNTRTLSEQQGYALILWTIDPQDWRRPGSDVIADHVISNAYPGAIVLMHDGGGDRSQTLEALGRILSALQQAGYRMETIWVP